MVNPRHISALPLPHCGKSSFGDRQHHDRQERWKSLPGGKHRSGASAWMRAASESHLYSKDESLEVSITWIFLRRKEAMQLVTQQRSPCIMRTDDTHRGWLVCVFPDDGQRCRDSIEDGSPARTYSLGIVPQHKSRRSRGALGPAAAGYLSARTGLHVEFRTARDIPTFEQQLAQGEYDFAYRNPFQYVLFQQKSGYRARSQGNAYGLRGIVVVRADSPTARSGIWKDDTGLLPYSSKV